MNHKFKKGDVVYIICYINLEYELGKIVEFDETKNMYKMIHFLDNQDPESFWRWCYVKEEDIDFARKIGLDHYKKYFNKEPMLTKFNYCELYTKEFELAKKFHDGKITRQEYLDGAVKLWELEKSQKIGTDN